MSLEIHYQSVEMLYVPVINVHPTTGPVSLAASFVEVALPAVGAAPTVWVTTAWASGTHRRGDDRYYAAELPLTSFTLAAGTTYQPWVRIETDAIVKAAGTIKAINS